MKIKMNEVIDEFLYRYADEGGNFDDPFLKIVHDLLNVDAVNTSQEYVDKTQNNRHDLTDEEILSCIGKEMQNIKIEALVFARAILRKAQENG